ncbi:MAG: histidine phosphatase family protein [Candidatus Eremiobacteraeota bacterium]|nr:histidine phosphatase family protein [Candidatus Eremiobacteraeota bacterium]
MNLVKVYFLRHGDAGDPEKWQGDDAQRPLSAEGRERTAREARALAKMPLKLDVMLTSPLLRAKQTAMIVAEALKMRADDDKRIVDLNARKLQDLLKDHAGADAIMLVGHEPSMSQTISSVIGGGEIDLKKGGLACFEFADASSHGRLLWLLTPKLLAGR